MTAGADPRGARVRAVTWAQTDGRVAAMVSRETGVHVATVYGARTQIEHRVRSAVMYWTGRAPAVVSWFEVHTIDGGPAYGLAEGTLVPTVLDAVLPDRERVVEYLLTLAERVEVGGVESFRIEQLDEGAATEVRLTWP